MKNNIFLWLQLLNIESARKVQKSTTKVVKEMKRIDVRKNTRMKTKKKKVGRKLVSIRCSEIS